MEAFRQTLLRPLSFHLSQGKGGGGEKEMEKLARSGGHVQQLFLSTISTSIALTDKNI